MGDIADSLYSGTTITGDLKAISRRAFPLVESGERDFKIVHEFSAIFGSHSSPVLTQANTHTRTHARTYIHTYTFTYAPIYLRTYVHTYTITPVRQYQSLLQPTITIPEHTHTYSRTYVHTGALAGTMNTTGGLQTSRHIWPFSDDRWLGKYHILV